MYNYPVPLCLHGHSSLQGLWWEESVQVDWLPAKVCCWTFTMAMEITAIPPLTTLHQIKISFQHVPPLPRLPAWWEMGSHARPWWRWQNRFGEYFQEEGKSNVTFKSSPPGEKSWGRLRRRGVSRTGKLALGDEVDSSTRSEYFVLFDYNSLINQRL